MKQNMRDLSRSIRAIHVHACHFGGENGPSYDANSYAYHHA
jgi:hypothetical protein